MRRGTERVRVTKNSANHSNGMGAIVIESPSGLPVYLESFSRVLAQTEVTRDDGEPIPLREGAELAVNMLRGASNGQATPAHKVLLIGNGGSAALASHAHNDLCKCAGLRAMVFNETPLLTALANDIAYAAAFEKQVELWGEPGDALLAISSSGKSESILRPAQLCVTRGCGVVTFTGFSPNNPLRQLGHVNFWVPSESYGYVEMAHGILLHYLSDRLAGFC